VEARNRRHYDGLGLNSFAGQALYIGPTFYATFGARYFVSAAWSIHRKLGHARSHQFRAAPSEAAAWRQHLICACCDGRSAIAPRRKCIVPSCRRLHARASCIMLEEPMRLMS